MSLNVAASDFLLLKTLEVLGFYLFKDNHSA